MPLLRRESVLVIIAIVTKVYLAVTTPFARKLATFPAFQRWRWLLLYQFYRMFLFLPRFVRLREARYAVGFLAAIDAYANGDDIVTDLTKGSWGNTSIVVVLYTIVESFKKGFIRIYVNIREGFMLCIIYFITALDNT